MVGWKKKSIKELETQLEQYIAESGWAEQDIQEELNEYPKLQYLINKPGYPLSNDKNQQMKYFGLAYLERNAIQNLHRKIWDLRAASASSIATSNIANTSTGFCRLLFAEGSSTSASITAANKSLPTLSPPLHHLAFPLLHFLHPMILPVAVLISNLCPTSCLLLLQILSMKSLPALRPMTPSLSLLQVQMHPIHHPILLLTILLQIHLRLGCYLLKKRKKTNPKFSRSWKMTKFTRF